MIEEGERGDPCEMEGSVTWRMVDEMVEHYVEDVNVVGSEKNVNSSVKIKAYTLYMYKNDEKCSILPIYMYMYVNNHVHRAILKKDFYMYVHVHIHRHTHIHTVFPIAFITTGGSTRFDSVSLCGRIRARTHTCSLYRSRWPNTRVYYM